MVDLVDIWSGGTGVSLRAGIAFLVFFIVVAIAARVSKRRYQRKHGRHAAGSPATSAQSPRP